MDWIEIKLDVLKKKLDKIKKIKNQCNPAIQKSKLDQRKKIGAPNQGSWERKRNVEIGALKEKNPNSSFEFRRTKDFPHQFEMKTLSKQNTNRKSEEKEEKKASSLLRKSKQRACDI